MPLNTCRANTRWNAFRQPHRSDTLDSVSSLSLVMSPPGIRDSYNVAVGILQHHWRTAAISILDFIFESGCTCPEFYLCGNATIQARHSKYAHTTHLRLTAPCLVKEILAKMWRTISYLISDSSAHCADESFINNYMPTNLTTGLLSDAILAIIVVLPMKDSRYHEALPLTYMALTRTNISPTSTNSCLPYIVTFLYFLRTAVPMYNTASLQCYAHQCWLRKT